MVELVRDVRILGTENLSASLKQGWNPNSTVTVYDNGDGTYDIVDGAHRISIVKKLAESEEAIIREKWANFKVPAVVLTNFTKEELMFYGYSNISLFLFILYLNLIFLLNRTQ